jgi:hypothetical protein
MERAYREEFLNELRQQQDLEEPGHTEWLKEQWYVKTIFPLITVETGREMWRL